MEYNFPLAPVTSTILLQMMSPIKNFNNSHLITLRFTESNNAGQNVCQ